MIDNKILHYKIIEQLGAGGMGVVYKAEDTKLNRKVALKFLPANLSEHSISKDRFLVEARAAAALNHPNIATVHAIEESEEGTFIVMEYVEGKDLKQKMETSPCTVSESLSFAKKVAEGLLAAHKKGITHRDVKPQNIMITPEGEVKIMDFGLAKLSEDSLLTKEGSAPGTAAYMSPEQASGEKVDHRSDIWSFGVVLYEMLCGLRPFSGAYDQAVIYSILNVDPVSISEKQSGLPEGIDELFNKLLQKNPDNRISAFEDVIADLDRLCEGKPIAEDPEMPSTGSGQLKDQTTDDAHLKVNVGKTIQSRIIFAVAVLFAVIFSVYKWILPSMFAPDEGQTIAILPFVNNSAQSDTDYLSEGIPESIIKSLQQIPGMTVTSFNYVLQKYKNVNPDLSNVGKELNVKTVISGRMNLRGEQLSISIEVINAGNKSVVYSNNYTQQMQELANFKNIIARDITQYLKVEVSGEIEQKVFSIENDDPEAYRDYLTGRYYLNKRTEEEMKLAIDYFRRAVASDSGYALAYSGISDSYMLLVARDALSPDFGFKEAKPAVEKALKLAPNLAETHASMGLYLFNQEKFEEAEKELRIAINLNPEYTNAHRWLGINLSVVGDDEGALIAFRRSFELDPSLTDQAGYLAGTYFLTDKVDAGMQYLRQMLAKFPSRFESRIGLGLLHFYNNDLSNALIEFEKVLDADHSNLEALAYRFATLLIKRDYAKTEEQISTMLKYQFNSRIGLLIMSHYYLIKDFRKYTGALNSYLISNSFPYADSIYKSSFAGANFSEGNFGEYNRKLIEALDNNEPQNSLAPGVNIFLYHAVGDKQRTIANLSSITPLDLSLFVKMEMFDDFKSEPEFMELLRELRYEK